MGRWQRWFWDFLRLIPTGLYLGMLFIVLLAAGYGGPLPWGSGAYGHLRPYVQFALFVVGLAGIIDHIRRWPRKHSGQFSDPSQLVLGEPFDLDTRIQTLTETYEDLRQRHAIDGDAMSDLTREVVGEIQRRRVRESLEPEGVALRRTVEVRFEPSDSRSAIRVLSRPRKGDRYGGFVFESDTARVLTFLESQALLLALALHAAQLQGGPTQPLEAVKPLVHLLTSGDEAESTPAGLYADLTGTPRTSAPPSASGDDDATLSELLRIIGQRRVLFVAPIPNGQAEASGAGGAERGGAGRRCSDALDRRASGRWRRALLRRRGDGFPRSRDGHNDLRPVEKVRFSYLESLRQQQVLQNILMADPWTRVKEAIKHRMGQESILSVPIIRALSSESYSLIMRMPPGAYVHDLAVRELSGGEALGLPRHDREQLYPAFLGTSVWPSASGVKIDARNLGRAKASGLRKAVTANETPAGSEPDDGAPLQNPVAIIQLLENPPGINGLATLVACVNVLMIFITAVAFPYGNSAAGDLMAIAVAAPALIVGAYKSHFAPRKLVNSVVATVSLLVSASVSILAFGLYAAFSAGRLGGRTAKPVGSLGDSSIFWIQNWLWLILAVLALLNLFFVTGKLVISWVRYTHAIKSSFDSESR